MGLTIGSIITLVSLAGGFATAAFAANPSARPAAFAFAGVWAVVLLPVLYGVFGFVFTLIGAALYNLIARGVGGIDITIQGEETAGANS
jgi:hypothetical protein